jgi:hypothetical protein
MGRANRKLASDSIPLATPPRSRIVTNLARPGANVTGLSSRAAELEAERLQLLKEAVPRVSGRRPVQSHQSLYAACAGERASGRTNAARIAYGLPGPR